MNVLAIAKDFYNQQLATIEGKSNDLHDKAEKQAKKNPKYRTLAQEKRKLDAQARKLGNQMTKIVKLPANSWEFSDHLKKQLTKDYNEVRIKGALNGMTEEAKKKMLRKFATTDYTKA